MVTWFDTITLINTDGRIKEIDSARANIDQDGAAARIYISPDRAPKWEYEGMEVVVGNEQGDVLFAGQVLTIDDSQQSITDEEGGHEYRCLKD